MYLELKGPRTKVDDSDQSFEIVFVLVFFVDKSSVVIVFCNPRALSRSIFLRELDRS